MLEWKIKLAFLWLLQPINYVSYILIGLVETEPFGAMVEPEAGLVIAVFFFVPCLMAWLSVVSPPMSRWPNIAVAGVFAILSLRQRWAWWLISLRQSFSTSSGPSSQRP